jgi:hypothetical protein
LFDLVILATVAACGTVATVILRVVAAVFGFSIVAGIIVVWRKRLTNGIGAVIIYAAFAGRAPGFVMPLCFSVQ